MNVMRVLGMAANIAQFHPIDYGGAYWDGLHAFLSLLETRRVRCELVVFADAQIVMPSVSSQQAHLSVVATVLNQHTNVFGEMVNEYMLNGVAPSQFARPVGPTLWSRGSGGGDMDPALPPWDYLTFHPGRTSEWPRKMKAAREYQDAWQVPCVNDEPMGASDHPEDHPGQRDTSLSNFFDGGACAALECVGATFHSDDGIASQPFEPQTLLSAEAFAAGMNAVPLEPQTWRYTRGGLSDSPLAHRDAPDPRGSVRTYAQYTGGEAYAVAVQRGPEWQAQATPGWRIEAVNQSVVHLAREV